MLQIHRFVPSLLCIPFMNKIQAGNRKSRLDKVGFYLSVLCAVHCASTPLLVAVLPLLSTELLHNSTLELALVGTTVVIAGGVLLRDYLHIHKNIAPLLLLLAGFAAKLLGLFVLGQQYEPVIITSGAAFIILAYIVNWRMRATHNATCKC